MVDPRNKAFYDEAAFTLGECRQTVEICSGIPGAAAILNTMQIEHKAVLKQLANDIGLSATA